MRLANLGLRVDEIACTMPDSLEVDTGGLRSGAVHSSCVADALVLRTEGGPSGSQASHDGASAMLAAVHSVCCRQSGRIRLQSSNMLTGANRYDETDGHSSRHVATAM